MKSIILTLLLVILPLVLAAGERNNVVYGGVMYDDGMYGGAFGTGQQLSGNLWLLEAANVGYDKSLGADLVYFVKPASLIGVIPEALSIGLVAGPGADWVNSDNTETIAYLLGTTGGIVNYTILTNDLHSMGFWGYGKYFYELKNSDSYTSRWRFAAGIAMMF